MPPELLEPRNAPGACLYLSWLMEPAADELADCSPAPTDLGSASPHREAGWEQSTRLAPEGEDEPIAYTADIAQLAVVSHEPAAVQTGGPAVLTRLQRSAPLAAVDATFARNDLSVVRSSLVAMLRSVTDQISNMETKAKDPVLAMTPPPMAAPGTTSGNSGGGGSNHLGGVPAGGGGAGAHASQATAKFAPPAQPAAAAAPQVAPSNSQTQNLAVPIVPAAAPVITASEVEMFLDRAAAATPRNDAIIAVVDRNGQILGVRVEAGVPIAIASPTTVFAVDGAVAKARTAAFFSNDQAPLTSRTVRFISQSTVTQREVESNPNAADPTVKGPGFVAPIGLGGHFPPGVQFTPHVDLFAIEHTNRDSLTHPGLDGMRGTADDVALGTRFGADFVAGAEILAPESYGSALVSNELPTAQNRGIATLPGGVGLYKVSADTGRPELVGAIGVFFPGPDGFATFEQNFQPASTLDKPQTTNERLNAPLVKQAEYMAVAAAGGVATIAGIPLPAGYVLPTGRIDLAGITLEIYGDNPSGLKGLLSFGKKLGTGSLAGATDLPVTPGADLYIPGEPVPSGWLVDPKAGTNITADEVREIIDRGVAEASRVRAAIRLPLGSRTRMVLSVTDTDGEVLGLFRMPDATFFSIDVAVAKARNVAYYADAAALQPEDQVDDNNDGVADVPAGTAFTNRTFRYLASPFFPTGVDGTRSGDFSILNDPGINPNTAENLGAPLPANQYTSVLGFDAFNPGTNFRELNDPSAVAGNQNGIVFFPGSTPLYKNGVLVGGFGVSGDGVDQDDVVTFGGAGQFLPRPDSDILRADETFVRGVRLPYQKFSRNPHG